MSKIKRTANTVELTIFSDDSPAGLPAELRVTVWPKLKQVEVWTTRGRPVVLKGDSAMTLLNALLEMIHIP